MRKLGGLLLILVLALGLTACGGDGDESLEGVELIRTAATASADAGTAKMEMTMSVGGQEVTADGQFDFDAQQVQMAMDMGGVLAGVPDAPDDLSFEFVFDGSTMFMSSEVFGPAAPDDADWIRLDLDELSDLGVDPTQLGSSNNPADALAALEGVSEDGVEELGTEEIRGVETTHYRAEIDLQRALEQADVPNRDQLEEAAAQFGDEPMPVEVWIDDDGLVRREVVQFGAAAAEVEMTMEMFDYGEPVDIEVPDESDSVSFTDLIGNLGD